MLTLYTKNNCAYCVKAKTLLDNKGIKYEIKDIETDPSLRDFLVNQGLRSVPQIFLDNELINGGYNGLANKPDSFWQQLKQSSSDAS
jgi:glutaredoxin